MPWFVRIGHDGVALRARLAEQVDLGSAAPPAEAEAWQLDPGLRELLETLGYAEVLPGADPGASGGAPVPAAPPP